MIDLQKYLNDVMAAQRAERLTSSPQILLGEIIARLEAIKDITKEIKFDFDDMSPDGLDSWRGVYAELAFSYVVNQRTSVSDVLSWCTEAVGKTFEGFKGGDFLMGRNTPVWIANYGRSRVESASYNQVNVAVVGIVENDDAVIIKTQMLDD